MASKTLYEILEVSESASPETIRAAWERLSPLWDPERPENATTMEARLQYNAINDAYLTLANPTRRAAYDRRLRALWHVTPKQPSNTLGKFILLLLVLGIAAHSYNNIRTERARLEAEKLIAAEKAKEAAEKARVELEQAAQHRERENRALEEKARRQRDIDVMTYQQERQMSERQAQIDTERERQIKARTEAQRRREEQEAAIAARQQLARDRAELCRLERQRYGRALSC